MIPEIHKESLGTSDYVPEEMDGFYSSYFSYVDDDIKKEKDNTEYYKTQYENITIRTDDPRFIYFLEILNSLQEDNKPTPDTTLIYPTKDYQDTKKRIMKCSKDLLNFSFWGKSYPGSLLSVILGIQELQQAETDEVGLHSTALYDKLHHETHLIISKSGLGKTTYSHLLEIFSNERFVLIGDEWNMLNLNTLTIKNKIPIIGDIKNQEIRPFFQANMPIEERIYVGNKVFWSNENYSPDRETDLGKIILLVNDIRNLNTNEEVIKAHKNIPFIGCDFSKIPDEYLNKYNLIRKKIAKVLCKFQDLPKLYPVRMTNSPSEYKVNLDNILKTIDD
jgi:hypothetical protein